MGWGWFQLIPLRRCDQPIKQGKYGNEPAISSEWGYHQWRPYGKENSLGSAKYVYIYIHTHRHGLSGSCAPKKQKSIHLRQFQHNQGISLHKTVLSPPFDPCNGPVLPPRQFNSGHGLEAIPFPFSTWQSVSSSACVRGHAMPAVFFKEPERKKRT